MDLLRDCMTRLGRIDRGATPQRVSFAIDESIKAMGSARKLIELLSKELADKNREIRDLRGKNNVLVHELGHATSQVQAGKGGWTLGHTESRLPDGKGYARGHKEAARR